MNDESYILENKENVLLVEFPAFYDNLEEFEKYVKELNKNIVGKVFSDHPNGGTILKDVKGYASEGTKKSMKEGTIHNLVTGFEKSFNGAFAKEFHKITDVLKDEKANIGGFELKITYHEENIEIEFPQIGCVYTHMLGHDCHSIVAGEGHANVIIAQLKRYKENTLVECKLDTGRTHQIRVHFNYIGHPVYGDPVYGRRKSIDSFGQYLHSKSIRFIHPITKEKMFFDSELPEEFRKKLEELEK